MIVGIVGCGAIANTIVNEILSEEGIEIKYFYDRDVERAENIAQLANGIAVIELEDMIDKVDLIVEAASPMALKEIALPEAILIPLAAVAPFTSDFPLKVTAVIPIFGKTVRPEAPYTILLLWLLNISASSKAIETSLALTV